MSGSDNIERILEKAADVLGSRDRAEEWLDKRSAPLKGHAARSQAPTTAHGTC